MSDMFLNPRLQKIWNIMPDARLVGGCVRDYFLGQNPKDIDLAVPYVPEHVSNVFKNAGFAVIETGLQHGTVTVMVDGEGFELTTLRSDVETDGRHAQVQWVADWELDSIRRDFTFNAMYLDKDKNLYDYHNGLEDLNNRVVRFVGDADTRVKEDALRILRFFRFATRFKAFELDNDAVNAIISNVDMLDKLSVERVHSEFTKIFSTEDNLWAYNTMRKFGIFDKFFDTFNLKTPVMDFPNYLYFYSFVAYDYDFMKKFKATNSEVKIVNNVFAFNPVTEKDFTTDTLDFFFSYENVAKETVLMKLFNSLVDQNTFAKCQDLVNSIEVKVFPLTGKDLINAGYKSGPQFAKYLSFAKNKWLYSSFSNSADELLEKVKAEFPLN